MANYYEAYDDGHADGVREGFKSGAAEGYTKGHAEGAQSGYTKGHAEGAQSGYAAGYDEGYAAGGGGASSEWKYQDKPVLGYAGNYASDFERRPSVLYAPNAEGDLTDGQLADTDFSASSVILDFPKATSIGEHCFSGMTVDGAQEVTVGSGNFPEVTSVGDGAFAGLKTVTADFPKCTSVGIHAFNMLVHEDASGHPVYTASGNLSFPAMTTVWACFPAMSGIYDDDGTDVPYHVSSLKVPVAPVSLPGGYPSTATRQVDGNGDGWHWGSPGSGAEVSASITWSGTAAGTGFALSKSDGDAAVGVMSGSQIGPFGWVDYRYDEDDEDDEDGGSWTNKNHLSKFNVGLSNVSLAAVDNAKSLQDAAVNARLRRPNGEGSYGTSMTLFGLAVGSTITCSDGVYTVS